MSEAATVPQQSGDDVLREIWIMVRDLARKSGMSDTEFKRRMGLFGFDKKENFSKVVAITMLSPKERADKLHKSFAYAAIPDSPVEFEGHIKEIAEAMILPLDIVQSEAVIWLKKNGIVFGEGGGEKAYRMATTTK